MNSLSNLKVIPRKTVDMKTVLETYFVETHEYNDDTNGFDLLEYFGYESGVYGVSDYSSLESGIHHTILTLGVM